MEHERSAGVIVFHQPSGKARVYLLLDYGRYWDYPKGHLEAGESDESAALRELAEETGIEQAQLLSAFVHEITYFFRAKKELVRKIVIFFLAQAANKGVTISSEHQGYDWLPFEEARKRLKYANARQALDAAEKFLNQE
jgi:bis(5'-nucleosidyl)-tetraphosphatase